MKMKKTLSILLILFIWTLSVFSTTWEGKAARGDTGAFPKEGNYAKSNSFPKNELVEVTNPVSGKKITLVITDKLDVQGFLMILSPNAAEELGIGSQISQVSAEKKNIYIETTPLGTSIASNALSSDPDLNPSGVTQNITRTVEAVPELVSAPIAEPETALESSEATIPVPNTVRTIVEATVEPEPETALAELTDAAAVESIASAPATEAVPEPVAEPETALAELTDAAAVESIASAPATEAVPEPVAEPETALAELIDTTAVESIATAPAIEAVPEPVAEPETPPESAVAHIEKDSFFNSPFAISDEPELMAEDFVFVPASTVTEVPTSLEVPEAIDTTKEGIIAHAVDIVPEEKAKSKSEDEYEYDYELVLRDTRLMPPESTQMTQKPPVEQQSQALDVAVIKPAESSTLKNPVNEALLSKWIQNKLEQNKFYIQLATYNDATNVVTLIKNYENIYPMIVLKGNTNAYQVLVGPLGKDEYNAALERFRRNGFTDAFVKKGE